MEECHCTRLLTYTPQGPNDLRKHDIGEQTHTKHSDKSKWYIDKLLVWTDPSPNQQLQYRIILTLEHKYTKVHVLQHSAKMHNGEKNFQQQYQKKILWPTYLNCNICKRAAGQWQRQTFTVMFANSSNNNATWSTNLRSILFFFLFANSVTITIYTYAFVCAHVRK